MRVKILHMLYSISVYSTSWLFYLRKPKGDHGYATLNTDALNTHKVFTKEQENKDCNIENNSNHKKAKIGDICSAEDVKGIVEETICKSNGLITQTDDLRVQVRHEHSYGTKRDSSPEQDHVSFRNKPRIEYYLELHWTAKKCYSALIRVRPW